MSDPALDRMTELVRCIVEIMGDKLIAVDPTDMKSVLGESGGRGALGIGQAEGPNRAMDAAKLAMRDLELMNATVPPGDTAS